MAHIHGNLARLEGAAGVIGLVDELPWDSGRFGFKVARWRGPEDFRAMGAAIPALREAGIRLVYIFIPAAREGPDVGMTGIGARWVDRRTVFHRALDGASHELIPAHSFPVKPPSRELQELALASGVHSRFRVDPAMPAHCFHALYEAWILRSTMREIADEVLVLEEAGQVRGMVTISQDERVARIGLIAVAAEARGKGVGSGLVRAAEAWALRKGALEMEVVTQGANQQALALYGRCGYEVKAAEDVYHLWIPPEVS